MIDPGYRTMVFANQRFSLRGLVVNAVLIGLSVLLVVLAMGIGDYPISPAQVVSVLAGQADAFTQLVVLEWRLPIAMGAIMFGALLGLGGAIFQSLTRNPLGSPDIIGFDAGAYTAVLVAMLVFKVHGYWLIAAIAIGGGLVVAALVYLLAFRQGLLGFRLVIVGIAIASMLGSLNTYLMTRVGLKEAMAVGFWGAGSLSRSTWATIVPALVITAVVLACSTALAPALHQLELGDDTAVAHGVRIHRERLWLIIIGVATSAIVTAGAGPIGFIALAAPQIGRRVARSSSVSLATSACTGAALLAGAHCIAVLLSQVTKEVPVGLVTVCLGGVYFIVLLIQETRRLR